MSQDTSFSPLQMQLKAMPRTCLIPRRDRLLLGDQFLSELRQTLSDQEIAAGHEGKEPSFTAMRNITCPGCTILHCQHNPQAKHGVADPHFSNLLNQRWQHRVEFGALLLQELPIPKLDSERFEIRRYQIANRRNPRLCVTVRERTSNAQCSIVAEIGLKLLFINGIGSPLLDYQTYETAVLDAISAFVARFESM